MTAVHVVTGYSPEVLQAENVGATPDLQAAKQLAEEHLLMLDQTVPGHDVVLFIEEWHGGEFRAQRQLRVDPSGAEPHRWFIAEGPTFAPIEEKN